MSEDDYQKIKHVGGGSFGEVYKAKRRRDNLICALKYISKSKSKKAVTDARNEIYVIERLRHTNIIQLLQHFETSHHIVLVCEYVSKELFRAMQEEKSMKFSIEKVRKFSCQICSALYYLHSMKVLHRDLKPQNILLTKQGTIKVCDFGFARFMGESYYARTIQGTLLYMAPELFGKTSHVHYAEKVDLWALGCIIYELYTGRAAFKSNSLKELYKMHKNVYIPNDMDDDMRHLVKKLLTVDHHRRIPWPYILKEPFFKDGIKLSKEDLERVSPYTMPQVAAQKVQAHNMKVRLIRRHERRHTRKRNQPETTAIDGDAKPADKQTPEVLDSDNLNLRAGVVMDERRTHVRRAQVVSLYDNVDVNEGFDTTDAAVDSGVVVDDDPGDWDDGDVAQYWTRACHVMAFDDEEELDCVDGEDNEDGVDTLIVYIEGSEGDTYGDSDEEQ